MKPRSFSSTPCNGTLDVAIYVKINKLFKVLNDLLYTDVSAEYETCQTECDEENVLHQSPFEYAQSGVVVVGHRVNDSGEDHAQHGQANCPHQTDEAAQIGDANSYHHRQHNKGVTDDTFSHFGVLVAIFHGLPDNFHGHVELKGIG